MAEPTGPTAALAGGWIARPGQGAPALRSTRREWAPLLARGRPAAALPGLLSSVYALCGGAHRWTAAAAVAAAQGRALQPGAADRRQLQGDTLREHLRRLWLDWPRLFAGLPGAPAAQPPAGALAGCPLLADPSAVDASRHWIEAELLGGVPAATWWAAWQADGLGFVRGWAAQAAGTTAPAAWFRVADAALAGWALPCRPLAAQRDEAGLRGLAQALRDRPGFALAPHWQGAPAETGPWARLADASHAPDAPALPARPAAALPVAHRLAARLAEVAALLAEGGAQRLGLGALPLAEHEGLAWCEMSRGLLVHWVRLAPPAAAGAGHQAGRLVADCRVLAPTEWHAHPQGALAQALATAPADLPEPLLQALAAAFDPCVALTVERPAAAGPMPAMDTACEALPCTR